MHNASTSDPTPRCVTLRTRQPRIKARDTRGVIPIEQTNPLYLSAAWRGLMAEVIRERGRQCQQCQRTHDDDGKPLWLVGDHVHELRDGGALTDKANIMLLCQRCHQVKTIAARKSRMRA